MKTITTLLYIICALNAGAQEIIGRIQDEKKEPLKSCVVQVFQQGICKGGTLTDMDGNYMIKPLEPGTYYLIAVYDGHDSVMVKGITVEQHPVTIFTIKMHPVDPAKKQAVIVVQYVKPPKSPIVKSPITPLPDCTLGDPYSFFAHVYQQRRGTVSDTTATHVTTTHYVIDNGRNPNSIPSKPARPFNPPGHYILNREEINRMPTNNTADLTTLFPGVYQSQRGQDISVYGSR